MKNVLKWVATLVTLLGAVLVSLDIQPWSVYLLNTGAFLFLVWGVLIKEKAIIAVNLGLLVIYTIGVIIRL
jgi:hypothetical protein